MCNSNFTHVLYDIVASFISIESQADAARHCEIVRTIKVMESERLSDSKWHITVSHIIHGYIDGDSTTFVKCEHVITLSILSSNDGVTININSDPILDVQAAIYEFQHRAGMFIKKCDQAAFDSKFSQAV